MTIEEKINFLTNKKEYSFDDLVVLIEVLRSEKGCPWDREQSHQSIRKDLIEETYEVIEAIDTEDPKLLREELGDVLLQVVFHARIEEEIGRFTMNDVANDICAKLIHRHPHVFGTVEADTSEKVLANWEIIKSEEKERKTVSDKLRSIPPMLPALMRAQKVGKKAKCFDFDSAEAVIDKIYEELEEFKMAMKNNDADAMNEELGDLLLTVSSLGRKTNIETEFALQSATNKFIDRFSMLESLVVEQGKDIENMSMVELDKIWDENKHKNR